MISLLYVCSAAISWEEPLNNGAMITEYRLEWQTRPDADFAQLYIGSATNYEVRGLTPATSYSFRVQVMSHRYVSCPSAMVLALSNVMGPKIIVCQYWC